MKQFQMQQLNLELLHTECRTNKRKENTHKFDTQENMKTVSCLLTGNWRFWVQPFRQKGGKEGVFDLHLAELKRHHRASSRPVL